MEKFYYTLGLIAVPVALNGLVTLMQKLQGRKEHYWNKKRSYEMRLAEELEEEMNKTRG